MTVYSEKFQLVLWLSWLNRWSSKFGVVGSNPIKTQSFSQIQKALLKICNFH